MPAKEGGGYFCLWRCYIWFGQKEIVGDMIRVLHYCYRLISVLWTLLNERNKWFLKIRRGKGVDSGRVKDVALVLCSIFA